MKKRISTIQRILAIGTLSLVAAFGLAAVASGQVGSINYFKKVGNEIQLIDDSYTLSTTNAEFDNVSIGAIAIDDLDMDGFDVLDAGNVNASTSTVGLVNVGQIQLTNTTAFKDIVSPHDPTDYLYFSASGGGAINYVGNGTIRGSITNAGFTSTGYMSADGGIADGYQIRNHPNTNLTSPDGTYWIANTEDGGGGQSEAWRANQDYFKIRNRWTFFTPDELTTTDATTTTIATTTLATDSSGLIKVELLAKQDGGGAAAAYEIDAYYVNNGGTVTLIENFNPTFAAESNVSFDYDLEISGTDVLVKVNGLAATTIKWQANVTVKTLTDD